MTTKNYDDDFFFLNWRTTWPTRTIDQQETDLQEIDLQEVLVGQFLVGQFQTKKFYDDFFKGEVCLGPTGRPLLLTKKSYDDVFFIYIKGELF